MYTQINIRVIENGYILTAHAGTPSEKEMYFRSIADMANWIAKNIKRAYEEFDYTKTQTK